MHQITVEYSNFPEAEHNTVSQRVVFNQRPGPTLTYVFPPTTFSFKGSRATEVIPIAAPLGKAGVDLRAHFNTNGLKGGFNIHEQTECGPNPQFAIETLQSLGGPFTSSRCRASSGRRSTTRRS